MNSSKVDIEKRLEEILKRKVGTCIVLDGEWGVGKTTFWKNFSDTKFNEKSVYVSLFGKESIQEIKQEIGIQIYKRNKYIKEIEKSKADQVFNLAIPNLGSALMGCISLFKKEDFKDTVICFDDFERISDKLNLKDILGLISEYKEQQNCHIVMILNSSKMTTITESNQNEQDKNFKDQEVENDIKENDKKQS